MPPPEPLELPEPLPDDPEPLVEPVPDEPLVLSVAPVVLPELPDVLGEVLLLELELGVLLVEPVLDEPLPAPVLLPELMPEVSEPPRVLRLQPAAPTARPRASNEVRPVIFSFCVFMNVSLPRVVVK